MVLFSQGGAGENDIRKMSAVSPSPGRFSPGRKTQPSVSAPSTGLRPLIVSRVKCGADLVAATQCYRVREIRYAYNAP